MARDIPALPQHGAPLETAVGRRRYGVPSTPGLNAAVERQPLLADERPTTMQQIRRPADAFINRDLDRQRPSADISGRNTDPAAHRRTTTIPDIYSFDGDMLTCPASKIIHPALARLFRRGCGFGGIADTDDAPRVRATKNDLVRSRW